MTKRITILFIVAALLAVSACQSAFSQAKPTLQAAANEFLVCDPDTGRNSYQKLFPELFPKLDRGDLKRLYPTYTTNVIEFRDAEGKKWPNFIIGLGTGEGKITYNTTSKAELTGAFKAKFDRWVQTAGEQDRRIAGELIVKGDGTPLTVEVKTIEKIVTETVKVKDAKGVEKGVNVSYFPADVVLIIGDKAYPLKAKIDAQFPGPGEGADKDFVHMNIRMTVKGSDIGFKAEGSTGDINIRAGVSAYQKFNIVAPAK
ncbi:MAG: hypothetical protein WCJ56_03645 [bacterium]